jgi:MFS family permease
VVCICVADCRQAIVGVYFVQVIHLTGVGVLTSTITATTGGAERGTWLAETVAITAGTLSPPISQAADLWGRKWFVVFFTICGAVGCLIISRADGFNQLIAGQTIGAFHAGAQCLIHAIASEIMPRKYRPIAQAATATAGGLGGSVGARKLLPDV